MKKTLILLVVLAFGSCFEEPQIQEPNVELETIQVDYLKWWVYYNNNIYLSRNFVAFDHDSKKIGKEKFFKLLLSKKFIPLKLKTGDARDSYKLFKLTNAAAKDILRTIKNEAITALKNYQWIGKRMPQFEFEALDGTIFNNQNTRGKTIIIKCWFIQCRPCVKEIPKLNTLVKQNNHRNDTLFLAISRDSKEDLEKFLTQKKFEYKIIPEKGDFIRNVLNVGTYPTHIVIDKNGIVKEMVQNADELIYFLNNDIPVPKMSVKNLPPPPPPALEPL